MRIGGTRMAVLMTLIVVKDSVMNANLDVGA